MSDRVIQSYHDSGERVRQSVHSYQSLWMSRWSGASCNSALQEQSRSSSPLQKDEVDQGTNQCHAWSGMEITSDISGSVKGGREVKARNFEIVNDSLATSSRNLRNDRPSSQDPLPIVHFSQKSSTSILKNNQETNMQLLNCQFGGRHFPAKNSVGPMAAETSSRECSIQHQSVSQSTTDLVNSHMIFSNNFALTRSPQDRFTGTTSRVSPQGFNLGDCRFDRERSSEPMLCRQEKVNDLRSVLASRKHLSDTNSSMLDQEKGKDHDPSAILVGKKKRDNCSTSVKPVIPYLRKDDDSGTGLFSNWSSPLEMTKLDTKHCGSYLHAKTSSVDTITRDFLITKRTEYFRESGAFDEVQGNSSSDLHSFSQLGGHNQGIRLQLLDSSTDSEGKENGQGVDAFKVVSKNESSAETKTMDMDNFKEKYLSGVNSSSSNKNLMMDTELPSIDAIASSGTQVGHKRPIPDLPDMNMELPAPPVAVNSTENADQSTSRTQSLDMDLVLHVERPSNPNSNQSLDGLLGPDLSSRWIKRLKASASSGSHSIGTKSLNLEEAKSHEIANKFFNNVIKGGTTNLDELTLPKRAGKELVVLDQKSDSVRYGGSSSVSNVNKGDEITLSHTWIQRWCRSSQAVTPQKKPEGNVVCDPQSSKVNKEDFQKKQFPSIAAMALMGKAMNGFRPCKVQNRGTFVVWNTKS